MPLRGPIGFLKGWNTKASVTTLPENSLSDAQNVNIFYGDLVKRSGSASINSSAISGTPPIHGVFDWQTAAGQRYLIVTAGTKIFQDADLGTSLTDITGSVTITTGQDNQSTFASLNNILVRCGGATPDAPIKWTGSGNAAALGGSPPSGNIVCTANNFMFISGIANTPSRIYWSNVSDAETWNSVNFVDFRKSDGDKVTALAEMNQNLIIFKRRSVGQLWTIPPSSSVSVTLGPLTQVLIGIGCVGAQALDKLPDGRLVFLGTNAHVYIFDGATVEDISDRNPNLGSIQPTLDACNPARLQFAVVRYYPVKNEIWISISESTSTTQNAIYVYSLTHNCWESRFTGIAANVMATSIDTRSTPSHNIIMLTGNYAGFVYEQDKGSANAEDANGIIDGYGTVSVFVSPETTDFIPLSGMFPIDSQGITQLELNYGFNGYTEVSKSTMLSQNGGGGQLDSFTLDVSALGGTSTLLRRANLASSGRVNSVQIQFRNRQSSQPFTVHPFFLSDEVIT